TQGAHDAKYAPGPPGKETARGRFCRSVTSQIDSRCEPRYSPHMSRRFVALALGVAAITASGALAKPPGGPQPDPELPLLSSLCQTQGSYPHPIADCSAVQVSCPSTAKATFACKTVATTGTANAGTRKLELVLPKRYSALALLCRTQTGIDLTCRVGSRRSTV